MLMREKTLSLEWTIIVVLCFGRMGLGALTFTNYPSQSVNQLTCEGSPALLIWNYNTDETVTSIDWYKQPGNVLIGNFGLGSFTPSAAYSGRVTQYQTGTYKAAIQITNFRASDGGEYTCTVKATTDHSQNGKMFYGNPPDGNVVIDYSYRKNSTCFPPNGTSGVTVTWTGTDSDIRKDGVYGINTCQGGHVICCMSGGSAACGNGSYCVEEDIPMNFLCVLLCLLIIILDVISTIVIKVRMIKKQTDVCFGYWWILIIALPVLGIIVMLLVMLLPCIESYGLASLYGILIGIGFSGPSLAIKILKCKYCKGNDKGCPNICKEMMSCSCCRPNTVNSSNASMPVDDNSTAINKEPPEEENITSIKKEPPEEENVTSVKKEPPEEENVTSVNKEPPEEENITSIDEGKTKKKKRKKRRTPESEESPGTPRRDLPALQENPRPLPEIKKQIQYN